MGYSVALKFNNPKEEVKKPDITLFSINSLIDDIKLKIILTCVEYSKKDTINYESLLAELRSLLMRIVLSLQTNMHSDYCDEIEENENHEICFYGWEYADLSKEINFIDSINLLVKDLSINVVAGNLKNDDKTGFWEEIDHIYEMLEDFVESINMDLTYVFIQNHQDFIIKPENSDEED